MQAHLLRNILDVHVIAKPFGIKIQTRDTASVVEIDPQSPAAMTEIRTGYQMVAINGTKVAADTCYDIYQNTKVPFVVRFRCNIGLTH